MIYNFLYVAFGGAVGSMIRYSLTLLAAYMSISSLIATFLANICGSLLIGIVMAVSTSTSFTLFASVGLCGGFTTFSTFSAQTLELIQTGQYLLGFSYALVSVLSCVMFVLLGMFLGNYFK